MITMSNGQVVDVVEGTVEARNERGVTVGGEWRNVSRFHPVDLPPQGARVRLQLDAKGFIRSLEVLDQVAGAASRDRTSIRLSVLQSAAAFAVGKAVAGVEVSSADVFKIAEAWERWVLEGPPMA